MPDRPIGNECPYCTGPMAVTRMSCSHCHISIDADFPVSRLGNLPVEHQLFIEIFLLAGGSLKEIAEQTGVSYPTVRSRLDKVIEALRTEIGKTAKTKGSIFDAVDSKMTAQEKSRLIKDI